MEKRQKKVENDSTDDVKDGGKTVSERQWESQRGWALVAKQQIESGVVM